MKKILAFSLFLCTSLILIWCGSKNKVQVGDVVSIVYTAHFSNGELFDQNSEQTPLIFTVGEKQVIVWLDTAVVGMKIGKKKKITITPDLWYGAFYSDNLIQKVGKIIFDTLDIIPEVWTIQRLDSLEWVIRGSETDESGNEFVLFDINPRQSWDTLTYTISILAKQD